MSDLPRPRNAWRVARALPRRTSLRVKLITAVLGLVGVALALISVASVFAFRDYLVTRADRMLRQEANLAIGYMRDGQLSPGFILTGVSAITAWRLQGQQLHASFGASQSMSPVALPDVPVNLAWLRAHAGQSVTVPGLNNPDRWRVIAEPANYSGFLGAVQTGTLIVGVDLGDVNGSVTRLATIDAIIGAVVLAILAVVGVAVVRASMRPLSDIERTAQAIAAGDLSRRVPDQDPRTEVGVLGRSLNAMLAQIEAAFRARTASEEAARRSEDAARTSAAVASRSEERMRQFVADASHELRTPLTAIRGFAEYYRQRGGVDAGVRGAGASTDDEPTGQLSRPELDRIIDRVEQEAKRMGVLVDDMLLLARLDQQRPLDLRTVDLLAIAADAVHDARVIAPSRAVTLTVGTPEAALVVGDEVRLRQVVGNLMSNALTHTPVGTPIDVTVRSAPLGANHAREPADRTPAPPDGAGAADSLTEHGSEPAIVVEIADAGPGLTEEQREHVFERFYRADRARSRTAGGAGLGLAIVAALVDAHRGHVWVDSTPGQGATFGFALPLAPEARPIASSHQP